MSLTVEQTCQRLDNRLDAPLIFEGQRVKLRPQGSVCRQLYKLWSLRNQDVLDYESFKQALRFRLSSNLTEVTMARDLTPWIAGGLTAVGIGAASLMLRNYRNKETKGSSTSQLVKNVKMEHTEHTGLRPSVFQNQYNSCYFHAAMLMLYQMKDWFLKVEPKTQEAERAVGQASDIDFDNASDVLICLKELISKMSTQDVIPSKVITPIFRKVHTLISPNLGFGCQEDADSFLQRVLDRVKDVSDLEITTEIIRRPSKETLPLLCNQKEVPDNIKLSFVGSAKRRDGSGAIIISDYTFNGVNIREREEREYPLTYPEEGFVSQKEIAEKDLQDGVLTYNKATIHHVDAAPNMCDAITFNIEIGDECYFSCFNETAPALKVRCRQDKTYFVSKYFIVHVAYKGSDMKPTLCDNIQLREHDYALTCVLCRGSSPERGGGHYTAALKIDSQWWYYNDIGERRAKLASVRNIEGWPSALLFERRPMIEVMEQKEG